jgi:hypothetical protein
VIAVYVLLMLCLGLANNWSAVRANARRYLSIRL